MILFVWFLMIKDVLERFGFDMFLVNLCKLVLVLEFSCVDVYLNEISRLKLFVMVLVIGFDVIDVVLLFVGFWVMVI